jgi:alkanesulfonate monooxygenase SsuD/methylene tetrahydromethanopterin reductase-like flavin-dependent oxidoreductase (luciferase family)
MGPAYHPSESGSAIRGGVFSYARRFPGTRHRSLRSSAQGVNAMDVGVLVIFQNYLGRGDDADTVRGELRLADLVEPLGFDKLWVAEHHFTDYSAIPDNLQYLSYVAGRTSQIKLATGAVIVPWNDPLRVVERITLLDHLSGGRAVLGLGRGLARFEYEHFGIDMSTSRERFDEGARMIVDALESGYIEGDGPYYPQLKTEIRPRPLGGFSDRLYCVGQSPVSVVEAAKLGARLMIFSQEPWEMFKVGALQSYLNSFREHQGRDAPGFLCGDLMFCHRDEKQAEALAMEYMSNYFLTIISHYELMSEHFKHAKGYDHYASAADAFKQVGKEIAAKTYCGVQCWGTPEQILEKLAWRRDLLGDFELSCISYYGGMPVEVMEESVSLFANEVLPELHRW